MGSLGSIALSAFILFFACSDDADDRSPIPSLVEEREAALKRLAAADAAFDREPRTAEWADELERSLREIFAKEKYVDVRIESLACKATACRVEARQSLEGRQSLDENPSITTGDQLADALRSVPSGSLSSYLVQAAERGFWVAYLFRPLRKQGPVEAAYYESFQGRK